MRWLIEGTHVVKHPSDAEVTQKLQERNRPAEVWLEVDQPGEGDLRPLEEALGWHSLALSTYRRHHHRPSIATFESFLTMSVVWPSWAPKHGLRVVPLDIYLGRNLLVTVHRLPIPALDEVRTRLQDPEEGAPGGLLTPFVIDSFVDAAFEALEKLDDAIDKLEDRIISRPSPDALRELYRLRHDVAGLHTALGAQLDVFQRLLIHLTQIARSSDVDTAFRTIYGEVARQYEVSDSLRDLISGAMDVYLSTVSNRLNTTMAQLTLVASVFLPLTFLTGFFGMNFAFLVGHITTLLAFVIGLAVMAFSVGVMLAIFRWRRWI